MMDKKKLLEENEELKKEISKLRSTLRIVKIWMEKEVKEQTHKIAKQKTKNFSFDTKENFLKENIEEVISKRISIYFWDLLLLNAPNWTIQAITTAEVNFYNMMKNPSIDWFSIISSYHKVLDLFIESFITNNFRKFAKKKWQTILRTNDPLEKSLHLIVNSKYIMSVWRLYWLLKMIRENQVIYEYSKCFKEYLDKYEDLKNILLWDDFFDNFTKINKSEVLSTKRHSWSITRKETIEARRILIWDFETKNSIIYKILETQKITY